MRDGMAREAETAGTGFCFTNGTDATNICIPQYREAFLRLIRAEGELAFFGCSWTDEDMAQLAIALKHAHTAGATTQAYYLRLDDNQLTDKALTHLTDVLTVGAVPRLTAFVLHDNFFGEQANKDFE